jgi:hypothetical protein
MTLDNNLSNKTLPLDALMFQSELVKLSILRSTYRENTKYRECQDTPNQ